MVADPALLAQQQDVPGSTGLAESPSANAPEPRRSRVPTSADTGRARAIGDLEFVPVQVPDGPLLFSIGSNGDSGSRERVHYVQGPASRGGAQAFLRCQHNVRIVTRLDRRRIPIKNHGDPYGLMALDLPTARARPRRGAFSIDP